MYQTCMHAFICSCTKLLRCVLSLVVFMFLADPHCIPGQVSSLVSTVTQDMIWIGWEPPNATCSESTYHYLVRYSHDSANQVVKLAKKEIRLTGLNPDTTVSFSIWAVCSCQCRVLGKPLTTVLSTSELTVVYGLTHRLHSGKVLLMFQILARGKF